MSKVSEIRKLIVDLEQKCKVIKTELLPYREGIQKYYLLSSIASWEYVIPKLKAVINRETDNRC